ncbi:ATP-binding cassette domain-containing protein, partial [Streptomyces sp. E5N298]|uniref:ATP-binding cassette domain-containing protein n=1 Tax=Streptomyces sp. E5N298 TaxID=1851983 RepID=UPI001EE806ED
MARPTPVLAPAALRRGGRGRFRDAGQRAGHRGPAPNEGNRMNDDAVRLRSVSRRYGTGDGAVTALDAVSAAFARGTFTAVTGPSGSGKSTLLQCAAGLDRPT